MAKQKDEFKDIMKKTPAELVKVVADLRERLWNLRTDLAAGKVKNVREMHTIKRTIARAMTAMASNKKQ